MKKIFILIAIISLSYGFSQDVKPIVWLKSEKVNDSLPYWQNIMNDTINAYKFCTETSFSTINFNPSVFIQEPIDGYELEIDLNLVRTMTSIIVYQTLDTINECGIWGIDYLNERKLLLTSNNYHTPTKTYNYSDSNSVKPEINTLVYNISKSDVDTLNKYKIARYDSIPFKGKIAEFLLFDVPVRGKDLLIYQTYLALKYGVSLIQKDYINCNNDTIWRKNDVFTHNIAGVSKDTIIHLNQKQSQSTSLAEITIGLNNIDSLNSINQSDLAPMSSIIWADNGIGFSEKELIFDGFGMPMEITKKKWMVQINGQQSIDNYKLILEPNNFQFKQSDECLLLINRSGSGDFLFENYEIVFPDSISIDGKVYFSNINWDIDGNGEDMFTFSVFVSEVNNGYSSNTQIPNLDNESENANNKSLPLKNNEMNEVSISVLPNPNNGDFFISIDGRDVDDYTVIIYDSQGGIIKKPKQKTANKILYKENIDKPGVYFVKIMSVNNNKVIKVVIN